MSRGEWANVGRQWANVGAKQAGLAGRDQLGGWQAASNRRLVTGG